MLPDRLYSTLQYLQRLYSEGNWTAFFSAVDNLGYNDAGLICAQLRARNETALASKIESRRFK